jgi:hypothetical protein
MCFFLTVSLNMMCFCVVFSQFHSTGHAFKSAFNFNFFPIYFWHVFLIILFNPFVVLNVSHFILTLFYSTMLNCVTFWFYPSPIGHVFLTFIFPLFVQLYICYIVSAMFSLLFFYILLFIFQQCLHCFIVNYNSKPSYVLLMGIWISFNFFLSQNFYFFIFHKCQI